MTAIAIASVKGAPGVTTTVLAMAAAWPSDRRLLVVECDPDGGVLAARRQLSFEPGLVTLAAGVLRGGGAVAEHTQPLGDTVQVLLAPATAEQVHLSLGAADHGLWEALTGECDDVVLDCGRLTAASPAAHLVRRADHLLLIARPTVEDVALLRDRLPALQRIGLRPRLLLIDDGVYRTDEVADAIGAAVVARLPIDNRAADALNGVTARPPAGRARLLRAARGVVDDLLTTGSVAGSTGASSAP